MFFLYESIEAAFFVTYVYRNMPASVRVKSGRSSSPQQFSNMNGTVKYILIFALVVLVGFTLLYIFNIQKARGQERFIDQEQYAPKLMGTFPSMQQTPLTSSKSGKRTVVYLYSKNCPYCQDFSPVFEEYSKSSAARSTGAQFASYEKSDPSAMMYMSAISGFPTVLVVDQNKQIVGTQVGSTGFSELKAFVERNV